MLVSYLPLIICVIGGVVYMATDNKIAELGRLCFFVGLFIFLYGYRG